MKKLRFVVLMTVCSVATVMAQEVQLGAKGGVNLATISGDNTEDVDLVTAFNLGLVAEIPISEKFSFQPELMYSGQGYSLDDATVALDYLTMPLMGKYYVAKGLSLEAGPQIGYLLSAKDGDLDRKDDFNMLDVSANVGIGYKLDNGLNFGARYNLGLSDINNVDGSSATNRNGVFQISIGYFFF